ncbi:hypothetical protein Tco_0087783 [Tanacetum coccineum]
MQKAVLKQQFKAFTISSLEGLEKGYDMFQQLLSQLEAHGAKVSTEDANHKFLRSLPPAWSNLAMTMRTKLDVDTLSIDDLYNKLRVLRKELTKECGYIQGENEGRREDSFSKIRSRKEKNRNPELFADLDDGVVRLGVEKSDARSKFLEEENPSEQSRLGILFCKEIHRTREDS